MGHVRLRVAHKRRRCPCRCLRVVHKRRRCSCGCLRVVHKRFTEKSGSFDLYVSTYAAFAIAFMWDKNSVFA